MEGGEVEVKVGEVVGERRETLCLDILSCGEASAALGFRHQGREGDGHTAGVAGK